jgi:MFS family permease
MLTDVLKKQTTPKFLALNAGYFLFFLLLYTLIDSFNLSYQQMATQYGPFLPILNIALNIVMATISMLMMGLTSAQFDFSGRESRGSNLSFLSILFGILTYGCTPCVIAFFAAVGISFSVAVLPLAGLPYKLISLGLIIIGFIWVIYAIKHTRCNLPKQPK